MKTKKILKKKESPSKSRIYFHKSLKKILSNFQSITWPLAVIFLIFLSLGITYALYKPKMNAFLMKKTSYSIKKQVPETKRNDFQISWENFNIQWLSLKFTLSNFSLNPKDRKDASFLKIKKIEFSLKPFNLFYRGLKSLVHLKLHDAQGLFDWDEERSSHFSFPLNLNAIINQSPILNIQGEKINLAFKGKKKYLHVHSLNFDLKSFPYSSKKTKLLIHKTLFQIEDVKKDQKIKSFPLEVKGKFLFSKEGLQTDLLHIKHKHSFLEKKGFLEFPIHRSQLKENKFMYSLRSHIRSEDALYFLNFFWPKNKSPHWKGILDFNGNLINKNKQLIAKFQIKSEKFKIANYTIGSLSSHLVWKKNQKLMLLPILKIKNKKNSLKILNTSIKLSKPFYFNALMQIKNINLAPFLKTLNIPKQKEELLPISLEGTGISPCYGRIFPKPLIRCKGHLNIKNLYVNMEEKDEDRILFLKKSKVTGSIEIDKNSVFYKADLSDKSYFFKSIGQISYKKGFNIFFNGSAKNLKPLKLFDFQMKGKTRFKGKVFGDRRKATVDAKIKTKNFSLNEYKLGNPSFHLNYNKKILRFSKLKSSLKESTYKGGFAIDVKKRTISLSIKSPLLELNDLNTFLKKQTKLPIQLQGRGASQVKFWGPLDWDQMNFSIKAQGDSGSISFGKYKEDFLSFKANILSKKKFLNIKNIMLNKEIGYLQVKGKIFPNLKIKAQLIGKNLHLEELTSLNSSSLNGDLNFKTLFSGSLKKPKIRTEVFLTQTLHKNQPMGNSQFSFSNFKNLYKGEGVFFGGKIRTHFSIPSNSKGPFKLFIQSQNLDVIQALEMFQQVNQNSDLKTNLSGSLNLSSKSGGFWKSTGQLKIKDFNINQGSLSLSPFEKKPILVRFQNGKIDTDFSLHGNGGFFQLSSKNSQKKNLNITLKSKLKMNFFNILTNFLKELSGELTLALKLNGPFPNPKVFGSLYLNEGQMKIEKFPLSFTKIKSDILFSNKNIIVNFVDGKVNQGQFAANGQIKLKKNKIHSMNILSNFEDVSLVQQGLETLGSGKLSLVGNSKPFTLSGFYEIKEGKINTDLSSQDKKLTNLEALNNPSDPFLNPKTPFLNLNLSLWARDPIPVKIIMGSIDIHSSITGSLHLKHLDQKLIAKGDLNSTPGGSIIFNSNNTFEIRTGNITYNQQPLHQPTINFVTEARVTPLNQEEEYDVQLLVQGPLNDLKINLNSDPYLEEKDIVSLLVMGVTPLDEDSSFKEQSIFKLDTTLFTHQLEFARVLRRSFGIDFNLSSQIDQFNEDNSIEALTLRYQLNPNFVAEASQTLEKETKRSVKIEYKFNKNFSFTSHLEQKELNSLQDGRNIEGEIFGIDFQYKKEF